MSRKYLFYPILLSFLVPSVFAAKSSLSRTGITVECLLKASNAFSIPSGILAAIVAKENGSPGLEKINSDGTIDYGPAQVNTKKLIDLRGKYAISPWHVKNDPCYAAYTAALIVADHWAVTNDLWRAVGNYHSKTPHLHNPYRESIAKEAPKWEAWLWQWWMQKHPNSQRTEPNDVVASTCMQEIHAC